MLDRYGNEDLINVTDDRNMTGLHWAAKRGYFGIVQEFCTLRKTDFSILEYKKRTAYDIAY